MGIINLLWMKNHGNSRHSLHHGEITGTNKRLEFGGVNSQDLFDAEMSRILSGLPRVLNNRDDILMGGIDKEDHDKNLEAV